MRLVFSLVVIVMAVALLGFALTNMETRVPITFVATTHPNVSLIGVVFLAVLFGMTCVAIVALVEGAAIRLANRRLQREVERLDAELNYLRTQRAAVPRPEPDALTDS